MKGYRQIVDYSKNLEEMVRLLLEYKEKGELVYCDFNGHLLFSDTVTMDSAYLEVCGETKEEFDRSMEAANERRRKEKEEQELREAGYRQKVLASNGGEPRELNKEIIIKGLKFICEHRDMEQDELVDRLLELGCDFTLEDVQREMEKHPEKSNLLYDGIRNGSLYAGGSIICNVRDSEFGRDYCEDRFLSVDDRLSLYGYIRKVTGDYSYRKSTIESNKSKVKTLK